VRYHPRPTREATHLFDRFNPRQTNVTAEMILLVVIVSLIFPLTTLRPSLCLTLMLLLFGIKIVMQSQFAFMQTPIGSLSVNFAAAIAIVLSIVLASIVRPDLKRSYANRASIGIWCLLAWSLVTMIWTLDQPAALSVVGSGWPYAMIGTFLVPLAIRRPEEAADALRWVRILGFVLSIVVLTSPEFTTKAGRIGIDLAISASARSNPLVIGELGGTVVLLGILLSNGKKSSLELFFRTCCVLVGTAVVFLSGSRGQIFFALGIGILFYPVSFRLVNVRAFVAGAVLISVMAVAANVIVTSAFSDWELRRFSIEQLLYGDSSAGSRFGAVLAMAQEWAAQPSAWLFGLGLNAYSALPLGTGDIYSHVVFADALFELGAIGATLMGCVVYTAIKSAFRLARWSAARDPGVRSETGCFIALFAYHLLLINKQGALWGCHVFFGLAIILTTLGDCILAEDSDRNLPELRRGDELLPSMT
jgi:hypothetical protein